MTSRSIETWAEVELMGFIWQKRSAEVRGHERGLMDDAEEALAI